MNIFLKRPSLRNAPLTVCAQSSELASSAGVSAAGFLVVMLPILLLFAAIAEFANYHLEQSRLKNALLDAARAAAVEHASPTLIYDQFSSTLRQYGLSRHLDGHSSGSSWQILIESPSHEDFKVFAAAGLPIARQTGYPAIDNDYQQEQFLERSGAGPDERDIFQANTLRLRLFYPHKPLLPGLGLLIRHLRSDDPTKNEFLQSGRLPHDLQLDISMHSHPVLWPDHPSGQVVRRGGRSLGLSRRSANPPASSMQPAAAARVSGTDPATSASAAASHPTAGSPSAARSANPDPAPDSPARAAEHSSGVTAGGKAAGSAASDQKSALDLSTLDEPEQACSALMCCAT